MSQETDAAKDLTRRLYLRLSDLADAPFYHPNSHDQHLELRSGHRWSFLTWADGSYPTGFYEIEVVMWKKSRKAYALMLDGTMRLDPSEYFSQKFRYPIDRDREALAEQWERAFRKAEAGCATVINTKRKGHANFCKTCDRQLLCLLDS